jgi:hypothetical protein
MATQVETAQREVVHLEDAHTRPMMGLDILEPLPSRSIPYEQVDPFILVHEGSSRSAQSARRSTRPIPTEGSTISGT